MRQSRTSPSFGKRFRSPTRVALHRDKLGHSRLHPDKVSYELQQMFREAETGSTEWMLVNPQFGDMYMAVLALLLAKEKDDLVPVTSSGTDHGSAVYSLLADSPTVRRKARKDSKYTYLLDAHRKFSAPTRSSALSLMQAAQQYQPQ